MKASSCNWSMFLMPCIMMMMLSLASLFLVTLTVTVQLTLVSVSLVARATSCIVGAGVWAVVPTKETLPEKIMIIWISEQVRLL